jgi:hypothetical protein
MKPLRPIFTSVLIILLSGPGMMSVSGGSRFDAIGPGLGKPCDVDLYRKYTKPLETAKTDDGWGMDEVHSNFGQYVRRRGLVNLSCNGMIREMPEGRGPPSIADSVAHYAYYKCDPETKTCVCNDEEPVAAYPDPTTITGCKAKVSKPGDPCDFELSQKVEEGFFSKIFGNTRLRGKKTTKYDIAFYHVQYARFRKKYLRTDLHPLNQRRLCLDKNFRTLKCNSNNQCECLDDGENFKFKQVGDECIAQKGTVCKIEFLRNYTHQDVKCDPKFPCEVAKVFYNDSEKKFEDPNFVVKACGGMWGKKEDKLGGSGKLYSNREIFFSSLAKLILVHYVRYLLFHE